MDRDASAIEDKKNGSRDAHPEVYAPSAAARARALISSSNSFFASPAHIFDINHVR